MMASLAKHTGASLTQNKEVTEGQKNKQPYLDLKREFLVACQEGMTRRVEKLLEEGLNMNILDENDTSPLYIACQSGHDEVVPILLEKDADVHLGENSEYIKYSVACH